MHFSQQLTENDSQPLDKTAESGLMYIQVSLFGQSSASISQSSFQHLSYKSHVFQRGLQQKKNTQCKSQTKQMGSQSVFKNIKDMNSSQILWQAVPQQLLKAESPNVLVLLCGTVKGEEPGDLRGRPGSETKILSLTCSDAQL